MSRASNSRSDTDGMSTDELKRLGLCQQSLLDKEWHALFPDASRNLLNFESFNECTSTLSTLVCCSHSWEKRQHHWMSLEQRSMWIENTSRRWRNVWCPFLQKWVITTRRLDIFMESSDKLSQGSNRSGCLCGVMQGSNSQTSSYVVPINTWRWHGRGW